MVLPQGINKATGLRQALNTLRLSLHNCVGIGDAENDYAMLDACEIGVAVSWGSKALQGIADEVLQGTGPRDVAAYICKVTAHIKLPPHRAHSQRIILGHDADGKVVEAAIHGRNILIAGDPRSGKSWITGLFCEQLILQGYCLCVIDPEGDYTTLDLLPGVVLFGGDDPPPRFSDVARALRHPDVSIVIDLSAIDTYLQLRLETDERPFELIFSSVIILAETRSLFCFWNHLHGHLTQFLIKPAFAAQRPPIIKIYFHRPPHRNPPAIVRLSRTIRAQVPSISPSKSLLVIRQAARNNNPISRLVRPRLIRRRKARRLRLAR
jgi:haloacid dehalogenase-like hydrolase